MPKITINLITFNSAKYLPYCLESIKNQTFKDFSLLVIDNNSQDGSIKFIRENYPTIKIVENKKNIGYAKALNQAIHWTKSDYVLCLNQDIILEPNFLEKVIAFMDNHLEAGSASGKLYYWDFVNNKKTKEIDSLGLMVFKNHQVIDIGQGEEDRQEFEKDREIFGPSGAAPIYRRKALDDIKIDNEYFDENFFMYKEDVDLAFRLKLRDWKSFFISPAKAYHDRTIAKKKDVIKNRPLKSQFANYHSYRNHLFVLVKNEFLVNLILFFPLIFWYELKKFVFILFFERQTLKGLSDFFKNLSKMLEKRKIILKTSSLSAKKLRGWYK